MKTNRKVDVELNAYLTSVLVEISGHFYAPAALLQGKETPERTC
jgi:hypothetical protein